MDMVTEDALGRVTLATGDGMLSLDAVEMRDLPPAIGRRVVRSAVMRVRGDIADIGLRHVDELLSLLKSSSSFQYELPGGVFVERSGNTLTFLSQRPPDQPMIYRYELAVPGETWVPEVQVVIQAEIRNERVDPERPHGSMKAVFDLDAIVGRLIVRNWQPGDRIRPLGMQGSKKLHDIFVDGKVPRSARCRIPVVADDVNLVWVPGLAVSNEARVTEATRRSLLLAVRPDQSCVGAD
jgi:tRNA(Ile)-lysidine synthase